jgi:hypothetical protein
VGLWTERHFNALFSSSCSAIARRSIPAKHGRYAPPTAPCYQRVQGFAQYVSALAEQRGVLVGVEPCLASSQLASAYRVDLDAGA